MVAYNTALLAFVVLCTVLLFGPLATQAVSITYYLDKAASPGGDGSPNTPWDNADAAFAAIANNLTIAGTTDITLNVAPGLYWFFLFPCLY